MEKEQPIITTIILRGEKAKKHLAHKDMLKNASATSDGGYIVEDAVKITYGLVAETNNREVVLYASWLNSKTKGRKISVAGTDDGSIGYGRQQFRKGVEIVILTNAREMDFKNNSR